MQRSILENPKTGRNASMKLGIKEGILTKMWRKRIVRFYRSLIPSHIGEDKQLWLMNSNDIVTFSEKLENPEYDLSSISYVCISESISDVYDLMEFFSLSNDRLNDQVRIIYTYYNWLWMPIFKISGILGLTRKRFGSDFFNVKDLNCFLDMAGWENVKKARRYILPTRIPLLSSFFDNFLIQLPLLNVFALNTVFVARKSPEIKQTDYSVTVLIPCRNEEDNIEATIMRMPSFGKSLELLFINDKSTDKTEDCILFFQRKFPEKNIELVQGNGLGKGEAVREGMKKASGDICIILDADLTVIPEDLPMFYEALKSRRADFVHGTRMVYQMERDAMRFFNIIGNVWFSLLFSYILEQRTTDTLCGTKAFWSKDWPVFEEMRMVLKNSDRWGDYNLIFGAARFGLKVSQLPVRYFERLEGVTKMNKRLINGLIMLRVAWHALWKVKFIN